MAKPGPAMPSKIRESTRFYPYFKDCIGVIDGAHIPAMVRGQDEGSAHDSKLLNDALSRRNGLKVPQGKYFLVDCGFPNRHQFLAPFRGVRYHLQDFAGHGDESSSSSVLPVNEEENLEPTVQTQEQQRENANAWRATIALDMWRNAT
ncbi:unnamed protein product [Prunus armeniaca]